MSWRRQAMKNSHRFIIMVFIAVILQTTLSMGSVFTREEYSHRRSRLMEHIPDGVAIIRGAALPASDHRFVQNTDFFYFTGVEVPDAALIIDGLRKESLLFFSISEREAVGMGLPLKLVRNPKDFTGIKRVYPIDQFSNQLFRLCRQVKVFYTPFRPEELARENSNEKFNALQRAMTLNIWDGRLTRELRFVKNLKEKFPQVEIKDCSLKIWGLRMIKSPAEIAVLRKAGQIGVEAHTALIQSTRSNVNETELAAVFRFICKKEGAHDLAYETILMSGKNHAYGHYHHHDRTLQDGDFIILDAGPDYNNYHVDISSTFPANGKYSPEQRQLYELGLGIRQVCLDNYRPGVSFRQVGDNIRLFLIDMGLDPNNPKYRGLIRYGGYNHMIGLATHDVVNKFAGPDEVLKPGFVFACDINIPYPEKELGIRIEDTIAITKDGYENLSNGLPRTIKEIEDLMRKPGILQIIKKEGRY